MKTKIIILKLTCLLIVQFNYGQIPVTDVAANANLVIVNTQLATVNTQLGTLLTAIGGVQGTLGTIEGTSAAIETTGASNDATNASNLTESIAQGETMVAQLEEMQEIQDQLSTIKEGVKNMKQIKNSLVYIFHIVKDTNYILTEANTLTVFDLKVFNSNDINQLNEQFDVVLETVNTLMETIQNLVKDNMFKMDEGSRLDIILDVTAKIKEQYEKTHERRINFENDFKFLKKQNIND